MPVCTDRSTGGVATGVGRPRRRLAIWVVVGLCLLAACSSTNDRGTPHPTDARPGAATSRPSASTATSTVPVAPAGPPAPPAPAVGAHTSVITYVDRSRPTVAAGVTVAATRTLPVTVYLPTAADGSFPPGPLPWIVFLHGFNDVPETYEPLLLEWVRAGYVVAAPTFPLTSRRSGPNLYEADQVNEPADVTFLLTSLLTQSGTPGNLLSGLLDAGRIGIAGHSDGANVAYVSGFSTAFGDRRIRAVVDLAGELPTGMGPFDTSPEAVPLLMVHGDHDEFIPTANSQALYDATCCRKWWIELVGTSHLPPFAGVEPWAGIVSEASTAFWNVFLGGYDVAPGAITAAADHPPTAVVHTTS
jgi:fermentation-respiration switch protein FrsA (DUF1100 family)